MGSADSTKDVNWFIPNIIGECWFSFQFEFFAFVDAFCAREYSLRQCVCCTHQIRWLDGIRYGYGGSYYIDLMYLMQTILPC